MHDLKINKTKNRVTVTMKGRITVEEAESFLEEMAILSIELKGGYSVISDMSEIELSGDKRMTAAMVPMMDFFHNLGMGDVIRVTEKSASGESISKVITQKAAKVGYRAKIAHSVEEAENILDEMDRWKERYDLSIDTNQNRLYMAFKDDLGTQGTEFFLEKFHDRILELQAGFWVISDLSQLSIPAAKQMVNYMVVIIEYLQQYQVGGVVRIVAPSSTGETVSQLFGQKTKRAHYTVKVAHSPKEAEAILEAMGL